MNHQTPGRTSNGAVPVTKSTPDSSTRGAEKTHEQSRHAAGPDGPDAREVGETFKQQPDKGSEHPDHEDGT